MSDYKFKSFSEIDTVEEPSEEATVVGIENGKPIQMPMKSVKASGGDPIIINFNDSSIFEFAFGDKVKEGLLNDTPVWVYYPISSTYSRILGFNTMTQTTGGYLLPLIPAIRPFYSGSSVYGTGANTDGYTLVLKVSTNEV